MSMKRTKQRSGGRDGKDTEVDFWAKPQAPEKVWAEEVEGKDEASFAAYSLSTKYALGQLVSHVKFGKGIVVDVEASRVEILFADGKKKLGHGQAS